MVLYSLAVPEFSFTDVEEDDGADGGWIGTDYLSRDLKTIRAR